MENTMSFTNLKSKSTSSLEKLTQELVKMNQQGESQKDVRFWYPNVDKAGNGYAVIRFLPAPGDEELPFIRMFEHGFKGPTGSWYIENSLTSIGKVDPVSEYNTKLWNISTDDNSPTRKQARDQKRKLVFISNIYVIQDQANPENNGKVFLFKFGKKIYDKLNEAMNPQFADEDPLNPFDFWSGADFKLKIRNLDGYRNYDKSEFSKPGPLFNNDEQMEAIWNQEHSLDAFLNPSNFKTYDELKAKLNKVLGLNDNGGMTPAAARATYISEDDIPRQYAKQERATQTVNDSEDDEDLAFFKKLAS